MTFFTQLSSDSLLFVIVLAIIQGVTEFLPISSSGHLLIFSDLLGHPLESLELSIALHVGSLTAIVVYYRRQVAALALKERRTVVSLVVASIPAVICGAVAYFSLDSLLEDARVAAALLPVTALVLISTRRMVPGCRVYQALTWSEAFRIGVWQALAILPGLSRSGMTIAGGLRERLEPRAAAAFSFLMAIPAISGAGLLAGYSAWKNGGTQWPLGELACGWAVSCLTGLVALRVLERHLQRRKLGHYAIWCLAVSAIYWLVKQVG
ncbi:MAG: undecaprenyl-diphosphatase [Pirellulaceae bacterium]|nr:MAG: undecaprenyl-diphosphatase [Pirellulaceae bacterium]GIW95412.1 MAG: undecaprenyl-diphosphatase [Pirellulaceae bacterium]